MELSAEEIDLRSALLGRDLIAWSCNATHEALARRLPSGDPLPGHSEDALSGLMSAAEAMARGSEGQEDVINFTADLVTYEPESGTTLACSLRLKAGGSLPSLPDGNEVTTLFATLARDLFPVALLLARTASSRRAWLGLAHSLSVHPKSGEFLGAVLDDSALASLYPTANDEGEFEGRWTTSSGRQRIRRVNDLGLDLLVRTFELWHARSDLDPAVFVEQAVALVALLEQAARQRPINVRATARLAGFAIASQSELRLAGAGDGRVCADASEGQPGDGSRPLLELTVPWMLVASPPDQRRSTPPDASRRLSRAVRQFQHAALLATDVGLEVREEYRAIPDPFEDTADRRYRLRNEEDPLSNEHVAALQAAIDRLQLPDTQPVAVAMERTLRASVERDDPVDGFIDAVVAWESLFGSEQGELRFRISAAIAWLLAESPEARRDRFDRVSALYHQRSRVVHGGVINDLAAEQHRSEAVRVSRLCLRALLWQRTDLLPAGDRGTRLVLGEGPS